MSGSSDSTQPERLAHHLRTDPVLADAEVLKSTAEDVWRKARALHDLIESWARPRTARPMGEDDQWCMSCLRVGMMSPAARAQLCEWCRRWRYLHGDLPATDLLDRRRRGERITQRVTRSTTR